MLSFIIRRLSYGFLVLLGVLTVVFFIFNILPGDPARMMLGQRADQEAIDEINRELGLDKNLFAQYMLYLNDLSPISYHSKNAQDASYYSESKYGGYLFLELENSGIALKSPYLRKSYQTKKNVSSILFESLPETAVLAVAAILIASFFGIFLGLLSALQKDTWIDRLLLFIATSGMALPSFFVGIIFAWVFGFLLSDYTGLSMTGSLYEVDDLGRGEYINWANLVLPALTLGIRPLAVVIQLSRNSLLEVLSKDYIRTAKAKGLSSSKLIFKHAMQNALNPVITAISGMFASLMAGAVFVEIIFSWKGIGWEIVNALEKYDLPIVMGSVLIIAVIFVCINIIVDILYGVLDPRVRI
ncbi:MAG: ABC transporter permease [Bacteroidetes bacterium]|nr:MAG: ABC transporter permease [Bacteroidota bacterium]MBL1144757.1 ABC transporter permease [Bacteroidota bacterium]NOG57551.1 ABC transporter permease [Bacteroidota bacterium]